jgi:hypothetical protein
MNAKWNKVCRSQQYAAELQQFLQLLGLGKNHITWEKTSNKIVLHYII